MMEWEQLFLEGIEARQAKDSAQWKLGDLALAIEVQYGGHTLEDYAQRIGAECRRLLQYRWVARQYESSVRTENLTWSHHERIAARPDRLEWLEKAEAGGWSVRRMQAWMEALDRLSNALRNALEEVKRTNFAGLTMEELVEVRDFAAEAREWAAEHHVRAAWAIGGTLGGLRT